MASAIQLRHQRVIIVVAANLVSAEPDCPSTEHVHAAVIPVIAHRIRLLAPFCVYEGKWEQEVGGPLPFLLRAASAAAAACCSCNC